MVELELLFVGTSNELTNLGIHYRQQFTSETETNGMCFLIKEYGVIY